MITANLKVVSSPDAAELAAEREKALQNQHQWFGSKSYAQHGDDLILLSIFQRLDIKKPSYLDIGAYHPFELSNTALLYERGSRGINVEPNPKFIDAFHKYRPEDINVNVGISASAGRRRFYIHHPTSGLNSCLETQVNCWGMVDQFDIDVMTVGDVVDQYAGGVFPDLLSVDAEGLDAEILSSIDYTQTAPKVICAEVIAAPNENSAEIKGLLELRGYVPLFWSVANIFFIKADYFSTYWRCK